MKKQSKTTPIPSARHGSGSSVGEHHRMAPSSLPSDSSFLVSQQPQQSTSATLSPSSPESEGQSGSLPGIAGTSSMTTTNSSFLSDEPIPPPSPFDQPSTSRDFSFKVRNFAI